MNPPGRPLRVASWPHWYEANRYLDLFYAALAPYGIEHLRGVSLNPRVLSDPARHIDVLHLHWPHAMWRFDGNRAKRLARTLRFFSSLPALQRRGLRVVWTVHDVEDVEGRRSAEWPAYWLLNRRADARIFHSESARRAAVELYGSGRGAEILMPHGSYAGAYPDPAPRDAVFASEGIAPGRKLLLCLGLLRPYKGFDIALDAAQRLPSGAYHLLIAGRSLHGYGDVIRRRAEGRSDVSVVTGTLPEQRVADLLATADAVLLPYRRITGSGALLAALTFGTGVVAADLPYFREVLRPAADAAVFVRPNDPAALAAGIEEFFDLPLERRSSAARALAERYAWSEVVEPVARWLLAPPHRPASSR